MKQFLIVGSINCIHYVNVFPYIKSREVHYRPQCIHKFENGAAVATWYTTMETPYIPPLVLTKSYTPEEYPKYDNYDAINVDKTKDIPCDYEGVMGVPTTFLDKWNPEQFEIVGFQCRHDSPYKTKIYPKQEFENANDLNSSGVIIKDGKMKHMYVRLMIKRKMN